MARVFGEQPTPARVDELSMSQLHVRPGLQWRRFTYERPGFEFLGTVEQGASIGALARCEDNSYWQLNGDHQRKLNASAVKTALRRAGAGPSARPAPRRPLPRHQEARPVTVIVKRRRQLMPGTLAESSR